LTNLYHTSSILITALRGFYTFKKQNFFDIANTPINKDIILLAKIEILL